LKQHNKLDLAIKLSPEGKVECLSLNGKECLPGLISDYLCIKNVMQLTNNKKDCGKTIKCHKDDFVKNTWCYTAYQKLYHTIPKKKITAFRKFKKEVKVYLKKNFKPVQSEPWVQNIKNLFGLKWLRQGKALKSLRDCLKLIKLKSQRKFKK
jgi:hypothetical protein